ncbi:MAG TPA: DUF1289 domain-containing protein [Porticoccaceae bacterium]|nr:DUF1289 domain-containing protein [Porticoccaceae bacterium]
MSSPCVSVCLLNSEDICCGCYRNADEIRQWTLLCDSERRAVLQRASQRARKGNPFLAD